MSHRIEFMEKFLSIFTILYNSIFFNIKKVSHVSDSKKFKSSKETSPSIYFKGSETVTVILRDTYRITRSIEKLQ